MLLNCGTPASSPFLHVFSLPSYSSFGRIFFLFLRMVPERVASLYKHPDFVCLVHVCASRLLLMFRVSFLASVAGEPSHSATMGR